MRISSGWAGWYWPVGLVAVLAGDRLFLIMHDEYSGRARVSARTAGLGLAAGLLAELVMEQRLWVGADGTLTVRGEYSADPTGNEVLRLLRSSAAHLVSEWLPFLADRSAAAVARRLAAAGMVRQDRRGVFRSEVVWPAMDPNRSAFEAVQLGRRLSDGEERLELADRALAGLVAACGLTGHVLWDSRRRHDVGIRRLPEVVAAMPEPLRYLVAFAEAAIGEAVLTRH